MCMSQPMLQTSSEPRPNILINGQPGIKANSVSATYNGKLCGVNQPYYKPNWPT